MELNCRTLSNYPDYDIYSDGRIYSHRSNKFLSPSKTTDGYLAVRFTNDQKEGKTFKVHRLVAILFIPNEQNLPEVNHKDGNKQNNNVNNLEWVSHSQNIKHAWDNKLILNTESRIQKIKKANQNKTGKNNSRSKPVILINTGEIFESQCIAARTYGVSQSEISRCCNPNHPLKFAGTNKKGERLIWKYYEGENT